MNFGSIHSFNNKKSEHQPGVECKGLEKGKASALHKLPGQVGKTRRVC